MDSIKGILFDKDGTLIDFEKSWYTLLRGFVIELTDGDMDKSSEMFSRTGADLQTRKFFSDGLLKMGSNQEITAIWGEFLGFNAFKRAQLERAFNAVVSKKIPQYVHPITCLKSLFKELYDMGITSGIATMDSKHSLEASVQKLGIQDICTYRVGYDSGYGKKPKSGMVNGFCQAHNMQPDEIVIVGDSAHDIHMGKNAGVKYTIGIVPNKSEKHHLQGADFTLPDVTHLVAFLKNERQYPKHAYAF